MYWACSKHSPKPFSCPSARDGRLVLQRPYGLGIRHLWTRSRRMQLAANCSGTLVAAPPSCRAWIVALEIRSPEQRGDTAPVLVPFVHRRPKQEEETMSTHTHSPTSLWQHFRKVHAHSREQLRASANARIEVQSWSIAESIRNTLQIVWLLFYSAFTSLGAVVGLVVTILALPILLFVPIFVVAGLLQLATRFLSALGLV